MTADERVLAAAVSTGEMALVFLIGEQLKDWRHWRNATSYSVKARSMFRVAIAELEPTVLVLEDPDNGCRKRGQSLMILRSLVQAAEDEPIASVRVRRVRGKLTRYDEAKMLAKRFPEIAPWCPKDAHWFNGRSKHLLYFEALALAAAVIDERKEG